MSDCRHLKPKICGNKLKPFLSDKGCGVPRFVGIEDVTINQGIGIDLTEGVYAYDGNGNEIPYTVTPDSIDMCDVGEHTVIYRAMAEGRKFAPWFCSKQRGLAGDLLCSRVALRKDRTVTIEQIDPPRIEGLDTVKISPNVEFDPSEGVTAIDGNGNEIEYTYSGLVDAVAEGAIASFETEFEQNAKSMVITLEPIQSRSGTPSPTNVRNIYGHTVCLYDRSGKNMLDKSIGEFTPNNAYFGGGPNDVNGSLILNAGTYTFSVSETQRALYVDDARSRIAVAYNTTEVSFTLTERKEVELWTYNSVGDVSTIESYDYQLEVGSTASEYEPFTHWFSATYLNRTVYGGTLDVVTGKLVVDRAYAELSEDWHWIKSTSYAGGYYTSATAQGAKRSTPFMCSHAQTAMNLSDYVYGTCYCDGSLNFRIMNENSTMQDWLDYIVAQRTNGTPINICYELEEPQTYFLTRQEIALLEGQNNVWSDSGDVRVVYQESMPIGESIEYETVGERIITYTATDICGNTSEVEREILVGITAQACKSQACGAFVYCAPTEACEAIVGLSATACE